MPSQLNRRPRMTARGVAFAVLSGAIKRDCLISRAALERVAALKNVDASDADPMDIFHAFEETINGVALRLLNTGEGERVLCLQPESFDRARATSRPS